jgi:hypothetical protein
MSFHEHAYLGIFDGIVQVIRVDTGCTETAKAVSEIIKNGGTIERVTLEVAKRALFEKWPLSEATN